MQILKYLQCLENHTKSLVFQNCNEFSARKFSYFDKCNFWASENYNTYDIFGNVETL